MCGIAGIVGHRGERVDAGVLAAMTAALHHRGPDDGGTQIIRHDELEVGLGHRRLSIIDLSAAGRQPMTNEDNTLWLTFNGEIYNYRELREDLIRRGHRFASATDTEVILHGYEEEGAAFLAKLNGMFAFALWDDRERKLLLVRDRYGKKPLYYHPSPRGLLFASELKALLEHPALERRVDPRGLSRYLFYEYLPAPHCIIAGVHKIPAGHVLTWQAGSLFLRPYWRIRFSGNGVRVPADEAEAEGELITLLKKAVERRLVGDVPLGVFLSGGIDSSAIVALMAELIPAERIKTFSIGFDEASFDESAWARQVAEQFGTEHHEQRLTAATLLSTLPEVWDLLDEPFADASVLPTYLLAKFTRRHVTVALGGDGGDELFAGYDPFLAHRLAGLYRAVPAALRDGVLEPLFQALPVSTKNMSLDFRIKQFLKGIPHPPAVRNQVWLGAFDRREQQSLLTPEARAELAGYDPYDELEASLQGLSFRDDLERLIYLYSRDYLGEGILTKVDRASMAVSLEVRAPFLDVAFAEYVNALPSRFKLRGLTRKYLLKRSLKGRLPGDILHRKKKGFGIPLAQWLKQELKPLLQETFSRERIGREGLFDAGVIQRLMEEHFSGRRDNRKPLWTLLMFQMWRTRFLDGSATGRRNPCP